MTYDEYIKNPGGKGASVMHNREMYDQMYRKDWDELKLRENGLVMYHLYNDAKDYYVHFKIPSGLDTGFYYDTIVRFFYNDTKISMEKTLKNYQVQFYSNDPAFVFTFCYAFRSHGLFIKDLEYKMSKLALTEPAKERNPRNEIGYVKSLYYAYLEIEHLGLMAKNKWEVTSKPYKKDVWTRTVDHADDKIKQSQELADEVRKRKIREKNKEKNKEFAKDMPVDSASGAASFNKTNKVDFKVDFSNNKKDKKGTHFNNEGQRSFSKLVKSAKTSFNPFKKIF